MINELSIDPKRLSDLLPSDCLGSFANEMLVGDLHSDSRKVSPGSVFINLEGFSERGSRHLVQAMESGAVAVLVDAKAYSEEKKFDIPLIGVPELKTWLPKMATAFYSAQAGGLKVVGVTGTNGKSTITSLAAQLLQSTHVKTGVIGTLGYGLVGEITQETGLTTPSLFDCHRILAELSQAGAKTVAMEVSSHGIDQDRIANITFSVAVLANITRDHLDYHGSFDAYADVKRQFILAPESEMVVLNADDTECMKAHALVMGAGKKVLTYSIEGDADVMAKDLRFQSNAITFELSSPWGAKEVFLPLVGEFNVGNALAALSVAGLMGVDFSALVERMEKLVPVAGRLQIVNDDNRTDLPSVFVDYAHTPDALEKACKALKKHSKGHLWCVFGCGGDRDKGKRAEMGAVASECADRVVVTSDNPRSESPQAIIKDIAEGLKATTPSEKLIDRKIAIQMAVGSCGHNDLVLIAGKGHENYQIIGETILPFNDYDIAKSALEKRAAASGGQA